MWLLRKHKCECAYICQENELEVLFWKWKQAKSTFLSVAYFLSMGCSDLRTLLIDAIKDIYWFDIEVPNIFLGAICQSNGINIHQISSVNISANINIRCAGSAIRSQCQILHHIGIGIGCHWWSNIPGLNLFSHFFLIIYLNDPCH